MGNINSFPLILKIKTDDDFQSQIQKFESNLRSAANRASTSVRDAGKAADGAFSFAKSRGELKALEREFESFYTTLAQKTRITGGLSLDFDTIGLTRAVASHKSAEEALDAARRRSHAERVAQIAEETGLALSSIRQRREAEALGFRQAQTEAERRLALERQRVVEAAKMIAGPQVMQGVSIDPSGAQRAAASARAYATAQREIAEAATVAARAVNAATAEDKAFAVTARQAAAAAEVEARRLESLAATQTKVAGALVAAGNSLSRTSSAAATSAGAQRAAYANLSQQIADVAVQAQMGTNAFTILLQQGTQASAALAGAGGRLGALGRFLMNPWVAAGTTAALVLGTFVTKLHDAGDASNLAKVGANALADAQGALGGMFDLTSGKLEKQNELLRLNARLTAINLRADALAKNASSTKVFGQDRLSTMTRLRAGASAWLPDIVGNLVGGDYFKARENQQALARLEQQRVAAERIKNADARAKALDVVLKRSEKLDFSGLEVSAKDYQQAIIDRSTAGLNDQIAKEIDESLDSGTLAKGLRNKPTKTKTGGSGAANRIAGLEENGRDILDRINSIAAPFGDQPKLIQQTAKAMADLADITDDLNRKNAAYVKATGKTLPGYQAAQEAAKKAAAAIENAPVMAIQKQTDALADQVRIQELLAQGRPQEAEALQAKLQIIRAIGVELGKEPAAVQEALASFEEQRKRLAQFTVDANAANSTRQLSEENQILAAQLAGNERLADIMARQFQLEQGMAKLSDPAVQALEHQVDLNRQLTQERERQNQLISIQVEQARQLQSAFENFLTDPFKKGSLKGLADSITGARKQAFAREISVKLFGDMGASVEDRLRNGGDAVKAAGEALNGSADALTGFADSATSAFGNVADNLNRSATALDQAASNLRSANDNAPTLGQINTTPTAFSSASGNTPAEVLPDGTIVVTARRTPQQQLGSLTGLYDFASDLKGMDINFGNVSRVMSGGGYGTSLNGLTGLLSFASGAVGGKAGAAINGILNMAAFNQMASLASSSILQMGGGTFGALGVGQAVGGAISGVGTGMAVDGIMKALGFKGSKTGAAIGGAIGSFIPIPGGEIIGSAIGSLIGGALKKTAFSTSTFQTRDGKLVKGNNDGNKASASTAAKGSRDAVVEGFNEILEQFGGTLKGDPGVSIGVYDGKYRVSTTGYKGKLDFKGSSANGLVNFGKDGAEEAVKFAIQTMFEKGVIDGIRASTKKLISAGNDLEKQLDKAVRFESVFTELKSYTDPVGAAIDEVDKRFKALRKIFEEASASTEEYSKLEQLYAYKRAEAVEQASKDMTSSLQGFLDSLRFSGETGLSLFTRQKNAKAAFDPIAADILAGKTIDQDKFTETAQSYLDIAREIYGSTQGYFDLLGNVTNLTTKAVQNAGGSVTAIPTAAALAAAGGSIPSATDITGATAVGAAANQAQAFTATVPGVERAINDQTQRLEAKLDEKFDALTAAFDRFSAPAPASGPSQKIFAKTAFLRNA